MATVLKYVNLFFLISIFTITGCRKKENSVVTSNKEIVLDTLQVSGDVVTIKWTHLTNDSFIAYQVLRTIDSTIPGGTVAFNVDKNLPQFTDSLLPSPYVRYQISAVYGSRHIVSNTRTYARKDINFVPIQGVINAVYDKDSHTIYMCSENGDIISYDVVNKKVLNSTHVHSPYLSSMALSAYNGMMELYVVGDTSIIIYDAATMSLKDNINVYLPVNVAANNGKLFINCADSFNSLVVYDRSSKALMSRHRDSVRTFIKLIPGTNSEFLGLDQHSQIVHHNFDINGNFISKQKDSIPGRSFDYSNVIAIYPDGSRFILSKEGIAADRSLNYVGNLPGSDQSYTSFDFDDVNKRIYAGSNTNSIIVYDMNSYSIITTMTLHGFPYKVFYDNGTVIAVTNISASYSIGYTAVELF